VTAFLNTKEKSKEIDPEEIWKTTCTDYLRRIKLLIRWLHNARGRTQDQMRDESDWITPDFVKIKEKKSKRVSPYSVNEIWEGSITAKRGTRKINGLQIS